MLTRLLHEAGLELGPDQDLMPPQADNPDGFWENLRFVAINDEILSELGGAWDLPPAAKEDFRNTRLDPLRLKAKLLIESFRASGTFWGWKDPRNSLTLPFWQGLLPALKIIVVVRNPLEVAYSLHKRNGTSHSFGLRLWELYNRRLLAFSSKSRQLISVYDSFFSDPEAEIARVADFIGLPGDRIPAAISLVARNRRHTSFTIDQLVDARVSPRIIELYRNLVAGKTAGTIKSRPPGELLQGAPNRLRASVTEQLEVREELATLRGAKVEQERLHTEVPYLKQIAQQEGRIQELQGQLTAGSCELAESSRRLDTQNAELGSLRERIHQKSSEIKSLHQRLVEDERRVQAQNAELGTFREQVQQKDSEIESLRQRLRREELETESVRERLLADGDECSSKRRTWNPSRAGPAKGLRDRIMRQRLRREELETESVRERLLADERRVHAQNAELETLRERVQRKNSEIESLRQRLRREESETESLRERLRQADRQIQEAGDRLKESDRRVHLLTGVLRKYLDAVANLRDFLDRVAAAASRLRVSRRWKLANPIPTLRHSLFGRPLLGPGDLERLVGAYESWKHANREIFQSDAAHSILAATQQALPPISPFPPTVLTNPVEFPLHDDVDVSIIIPVFNQITLTQRCLAALQENAGTEPFEVIVVDDFSTDTTADEISKTPGVVYLRNEVNAGFIASCNRGAREARGNFLVFLNNDTEVRPGWLSALLSVFRLRTDAGLAGAKLVYADGRLQEAGGIIWRDASGINYGKWQNPGHPAYNYLREVDYCSGACILIPRALFEEVGGFDPALAPAYYEDTDLAFKIRQAGRKVYYQPLATVIHHEGATSGTSTESGVKRYQLVNQEKFRAKWQDALRLHPAGEGTDADRAKDRGIAKRVLVVDTRILCPDQDSGSLRMLNLLRIFQQLDFKVTFLPENLQRPSPYTERMQELGIECLYAPFFTDLTEFLRERRGEFDLIMLSRMEIGEKMLMTCRAEAPSVPVVFDTVDLHFLRGEREAELSDSEVKRNAAAATRALELGIASRCDAVIVVSSFEKEMLDRELPEQHVALVSNIHEVSETVQPFAGRGDFVFIGGFEHPPNVDAMLWFCSEIMPLVVAEMPDARLHIIGSKMPEAVRALAGANVVTHGYVENVVPFFDSCLLSIAPLRYGAGVKGKINQSMSFGTPVVSTTIGAEGMHLEHERNILIADEPKLFAAQIVRLHHDPELWEHLSYEGLQNIEEHFSFAAAQASLEQLLYELKVLPRISPKKLPARAPGHAVEVSP